MKEDLERQARLHFLERILVPELKRRVGVGEADAGDVWRPLLLDEARTILDELCDPASDHVALLGSVGDRLALAREMLDLGPPSETLGLEVEIWETVLEGAERGQAGHVRGSYLPYWQRQHDVRGISRASLVGRLGAARAEASSLYDDLRRAGVSTDEASLRAAYDAGYHSRP